MDGLGGRWDSGTESHDDGVDVGQQDAFDRFWQAMITRVIRRWRQEMEDHR
jgi:hypothetical protein